MNREQKTDITSVMGNIKGVGELDYVAGWYWKAVELIAVASCIVATFEYPS